VIVSQPHTVPVSNGGSGGIAVAATFSMAVGRGGSSNGCGGTHCTWGGDRSGARGGGVDYLCT
jgi:hypothetical protein